MRHCIIMMMQCLFYFHSADAQYLPLPARAPDAPAGSAISLQMDTLEREVREALIESEVFKGNVPFFLRSFVPVTVRTEIGGIVHVATFFAAPDYCAVGSDSDYFFTPLSPRIAQRMADSIGCCLPTTAMVDAIFAAAPVKLTPAPIAPSAQMTTVPVFRQHNAFVRTQRDSQLTLHPAGALTAGHKKDVVISNRCPVGKVAIYGWHRGDGTPIQALYTGHTERWVDYSHGLRFIRSEMMLDGGRTTVAAVLADSVFCRLLSNEGVIAVPRYGEPQ
ncbi:MAG: hypothetical protein NTV54_09405 [Ignavibacteriales bacterium]|nr:hypothetical protein [Ignavibacteriales bacterium]